MTVVTRTPKPTIAAARFLLDVHTVKIPEDKDIGSEQLDAIFYEAIAEADERGQPHTLGNVCFHAMTLAYHAGWLMRGKAAAQEEEQHATHN